MRVPIAIPGVVEEGRLRNHICRGGDHFDLVTLAIYRDDFLAGPGAVADRRDRLRSTNAGRPVSWDEFVEVVSSCAVLANQSGSDGTELSGGMALVDDLELDSIGVLEFVSCIEGRFEIDIPDAVLGRLTTLQDVFAVVEQASTSTTT